MAQRIITGALSKEISRHGSNVFNEFKADILLSKDKVAGIYLGHLIRNHPDRYARENQKQNLSNGKREIKIEVNSYYLPVSGSWLEKGFKLFGKLGEKNINVQWGHCLERIRKSKKSRDIIDLSDDFEKSSGKKIYHSYSDISPLFSIKDDINLVKRFLYKYKESINLDEAALKRYNSDGGLALSIGRNILDFCAIGTNDEAVRYSMLIDEFLR